MSVQVVTPLIWDLNAYYKNEEKLYQNRHYLDRAFSAFVPENFSENKEALKNALVEMIKNIDERFFEIFDDEKINVQAYILKILLTQNP